MAVKLAQALGLLLKMELIISYAMLGKSMIKDLMKMMSKNITEEIHLQEKMMKNCYKYRVLGLEVNSSLNL